MEVGGGKDHGAGDMGDPRLGKRGPPLSIVPLRWDKITA